eukprot:4716314-Ditylum_brightwellii.AAC.1
MDKENAQMFCEHFCIIFNNQNHLPCDHSVLSLILPNDDFTHVAKLPSITKVCAALCRMASAKAPGPSGVTSNALKSMVWMEETPDDDHTNDNTNYLASVIHTMLLDFWENTLDFESWKSGILEKGDLPNPNKRHPVCLLETMYKVLASIIVRRINTMIQDHRMEPQCNSLNLKGLLTPSIANTYGCPGFFGAHLGGEFTLDSQILIFSCCKIWKSQRLPTWPEHQD